MVEGGRAEEHQQERGDSGGEEDVVSFDDVFDEVEVLSCGG